MLLALDARAARVQQLRLLYTDAYPLVRQSESEQQLIDQRRAEVRRTS